MSLHRSTRRSWRFLALYLPIVVPGAVRHDGSRPEGIVAPSFGHGLGQGRLAEDGTLLQQDSSRVSARL